MMVGCSSPTTKGVVTASLLQPARYIGTTWNKGRLGEQIPVQSDGLFEAATGRALSPSQVPGRTDALSSPATSTFVYPGWRQQNAIAVTSSTSRTSNPRTEQWLCLLAPGRYDNCRKWGSGGITLPANTNSFYSRWKEATWKNVVFRQPKEILQDRIIAGLCSSQN